MNPRLRNPLVLSAILAAGLISTALAGKYNTKLDIGSKAPQWKDLKGTDDKPHAFKETEKAKAIVVVFTCNHCPVAQAYEDRLVKFTKEYKDKGVDVVAINVNNLDEDKLDKMKDRAKEKGFNFPYLYDPSQKIAKEYGATVTPHCFVLDKDRKVAYMGAFDDNQETSKVKKNYLKDAVDAILAGKKPEVSETQQFGCSIKYDS